MSQFNGRMGLVSSIRADGRYVVVLQDPSCMEFGAQRPTREMISKYGRNVKGEHLVLVKDADCESGPYMFKAGVQCQGCKTLFFKEYLSKCSKCKMVNYCSRECQALDWENGHKTQCSTLRKSRKDKTGDMASIKGSENRFNARKARSWKFAQSGDYAAAENEMLCMMEEQQVESSALYGTLGSYARAHGHEERALAYFTKGAQLPIRTDSDKQVKLAIEKDQWPRLQRPAS